MKRYVMNIVLLLLLGMAVALISVGCELMEDPGTPIFAETELMYASNSEGQFYFSPSWDVEYIVLGIFSSPIVTSGKSITNMSDMEGGSCTGQPGFTRSQVPEDSLYIYSDTVKIFTGSRGDYNPNGTKYWGVWGFNADWVIISSSKQITTDFP
jgi:hypothetical protein